MVPFLCRSTRLQVLSLLAATSLCVSIFVALSWQGPESSSVALLGTWEHPHGIGIDKEPWSAPANLWL